MKRTPILIFLAAASAMAIFIGVFKLSGHYLASVSAANADTECKIIGVSHTAVIKENQILPKNTEAKLCDRLIIINNDKRLRLIAFGEHEHHESYDNITERSLDNGQSFTITLNKAGTYRFHDHIEDEVAANFTVVR